MQSLHKAHRPPRGKEAILFGRLEKDADESEWQDLVVCPSRQGAHICFFNGFDILFKVKVTVTHSEHLPRYNIYNVNHNGKTATVQCGHVEKGRTSFFACKGTFRMEQAWHVGAFKLELKPRKGVLHPKKAKIVSTPVEAWSTNVSFLTLGSRDFKRRTENWTVEASFDAGSLAMQPEYDSDNQRADSCAIMRVFVNGELVCIGRRQAFDKTGHRHEHERPFIGIRLKASEADLRAGMQTHIAEERSSSHIKRDGLSMDKIFQQQKYHPVGTSSEVLPLLLMLAWCEEAMHPPDDQREYFMARMRSKSYRATSWNSDDGVPIEESRGTDNVQTAKVVMQGGQEPSHEDILEMMKGLSQEHEERGERL